LLKPIEANRNKIVGSALLIVNFEVSKKMISLNFHYNLKESESVANTEDTRNLI
jgi:hypothetical protein